MNDRYLSHRHLPAAAPKLDPREVHFRAPSHHAELSLFLRYLPPACEAPPLGRVVLYVHGGTFPSALTMAHRFDGRSWRDEKAQIRWRTLASHHAIREKGRREAFRDYHMRVGEVVADTRPPHGHALREQRLDETESGSPVRPLSEPDRWTPPALALRLGLPARGMPAPR